MFFTSFNRVSIVVLILNYLTYFAFCVLDTYDIDENVTTEITFPPTLPRSRPYTYQVKFFIPKHMGPEKASIQIHKYGGELKIIEVTRYTENTPPESLDFITGDIIRVRIGDPHIPVNFVNPPTTVRVDIESPPHAPSPWFEQLPQAQKHNPPIHENRNPAMEISGSEEEPDYEVPDYEVPDYEQPDYEQPEETREHIR